MTDLYSIGLTIFSLMILISRIISEKARRKLSDEENERLAESMASYKTGHTILIVVILILFFFLAQSGMFLLGKWLPMFYLVLFIFASISVIYSIRKVRSLDISQSYIRTYTIAQGMVLAGTLCFLVLILIQ